jgi:hypothetical protein
MSLARICEACSTAPCNPELWRLMRLNEIVLIFLWTKFPGHRVTPFRQVFQQSARARRWAMPGRVDIDAEVIPVLD